LSVSYWLKKSAFAVLFILAIWFGVRLVLISTNYRDEIISVRDFEFEIVDAQLRDNDTLVITLRFRNPQGRNVKILSESIIVEYGDYPIWIHNLDFSTNPLVVENFSEQVRHISIESSRSRDFAGKEIKIQVDAQVKIQVNLLSVRVKDTYTTNLLVR